MRPNTVFFKTAKGREELNQRRGSLSLRDRRVLMLVNGERNLEEIGQLAMVARVENHADVLASLSEAGFIEYPGGPAPRASAPTQPTATGQDPAAAASDEQAGDDQELAEIQSFMLTTLQAFTNRIRVSGLVKDISGVQSANELRKYLEPWYDAIAESPEGIFRADELRAKLLEMLLAADKRVF